jgi:hypothetical protein
MIGDWVRNDLGETQQVVELREEGVMLYYNDIYPYDDVQPIPLTPEILEKNGMILSLYGNFFPEDEHYELEISVVGGRIFWTINGHEYDIMCLRFVHQLQHALSLCGIDKEIQI